MCVDRQELKQGTHLVLDKEYEIKEVKGFGASCVVYLAEDCTNCRKVLIKELYPINLGIFRDNNNALVIPASSQSNFAECKEKLKRAVDLQISFHNAEDSGNFTSDVEEIIEHNNTLYVVMGRVFGESYDKHVPEDLTAVLKIGRSVAKAIAMYHNKGYLHLDIKAENVFKIKETDELIKLFDFDSVHTKEEIQNGECNISFTPSSASPEVLLCKNRTLKNIDETADLFSIGALMFKKIMGRDVEVEDCRYLKKWDYGKTDLMKTVSPQTESALTEIFRHTLARKQKNRYQTAEELMAALEQAIELSETRIFLANHNITTTTSKDYYISRPEKVKEIREKLENYHIAYLYGIGGIGKSETAREYAETYRNQYDVIHLTHYSVDLKHTITMLNFINLDDRELKFEEKYQLRMNHLKNREMYDNKTLLIIDNYNVSPDSDEYEKNVVVLRELKELDIHILFTTRTIPNDGNRRVDIEELSDNDLHALFFAVNPKDRNSVARIAQVSELIQTAYRHTLTVDLVAHQTVQIERFGKKTLADYIAVLKNSGLNNEVKLSVYNNKDDNEKNAIIFDHIKALFDFSELSDKERYVMVNACLLPVSGMETAQFCEFIDSEHYDDSPSSEWGEDNTITNLVNGGWMKRVGEYEERIALHPTVSSVGIQEHLADMANGICDKYILSLIQHNNIISGLFYSAREKYVDCMVEYSYQLESCCNGVKHAPDNNNIYRLLDFTSKFFEKLNILATAKHYRYLAIIYRKATNKAVYEDYIKFGDINVELKDYHEASCGYNLAITDIKQLLNNALIENKKEMEYSLRDCYFKLASVYHKLNDTPQMYENEIEGYRVWIASSDDNAARYSSLAHIFEDMHDYENAIECNNLAKQAILKKGFSKHDYSWSDFRDCNLFNALWSVKSKHYIKAFIYFICWFFRIYK